LGSRYQPSSRRSTPSSARSRHWQSSFPLYLLIFARIYLSNSLTDPSAFTQPLDNTAALYFTVTVFSTVGFGDIVAHTNSMRLLVTLQMLLNLLLLGLVIRLITSAARRGVARRGAQPDFGDRDIPDD
jgi:uncharacterized membrane protein